MTYGWAVEMLIGAEGNTKCHVTEQPTLPQLNPAPNGHPISLQSRL